VWAFDLKAGKVRFMMLCSELQTALSQNPVFCWRKMPCQSSRIPASPQGVSRAAAACAKSPFPLHGPFALQGQLSTTVKRPHPHDRGINPWLAAIALAEQPGF
jgi:hypothetical protein